MLHNGIKRIPCSICRLLWIHKPQEEITAHLHADIIPRDGALGHDVNRPFSDVNDVGYLVDEGDGEEVSRVVYGAEFPEAFDDEEVSLGDDVEDGVGFGDGPVVEFCHSSSVAGGVVVEGVEERAGGCVVSGDAGGRRVGLDIYGSGTVASHTADQFR